MFLSSFSNTVFWINCLYSIVCSCLLCQILTDHIEMGFFSGLFILFHWSICLFLCQYHAVLITMSFWNSLMLVGMILSTPNTNSKEYMGSYVHHSIIYNSQNCNPCLSIDEWMKKLDIQNLFFLNEIICDSMDTLRGYYAKLNKSVWKKTNTIWFHLHEEPKSENKWTNKT